MGRKRTSNHGLPPHMHIKCGTFYYVTNTRPRKWINLGRDLTDARIKWADLENGCPIENSLAGLIDEWIAGAAFAELSENTQRQYKSVAKQIKAVFDGFVVEQIKPHHIAAWQDNHASRVNANTGKSILTNVLHIAVRRGLIERNPAREVENLTVKRRQRYITDAEYLAIREKANPVLRAAMDISYVTGARIGDVLAIRLSDITAEGLTIRQEKTDKLQLFRITETLDSAIRSAKAIKRPVRGMFLLCTQVGKPYSYQKINEWWREARTAAGIPDVHFHDIRGKSATDAKQQGQDYQALLGHSTKAMSDSYIKLENAQIVEPLKKVL